MNEEEKEAIDKLKELVEYLKEEKTEYTFHPYDFKTFEIILNYIDKLESANNGWHGIADNILKSTDKYGEITIGEVKDYIKRLRKEHENRKEVLDDVIKQNEELSFDIDDKNKLIYKLQKENKNYSDTITNMICSREDNYISKDTIRTEIEELKNMEVKGEVFETARDFAIKVLIENILKETPEMIRLRKYEEDINNLIRRIESGELRLYPNSDANEFLLNILKDIGKGE